MYKTLDDLERNQNNIETQNKGKKRLKWSLIFLWILLSLGWVWAWLTKTWIIPNWFGIEALCPNTKIISTNISNNYKSNWNDILLENNNYTENYNLDYISNNNIDSKIVIEWNNIENNQTIAESGIDWFHIMPKLNSGDLNDVMIDTIEIENKHKHWEDYKPIIYIYPTSETKVNVKLWTPENLSHTYPKYNSEKWRNVTAQPNWELEDMDTWRKLYALYREWKSDIKTNFDEWFVVEWKDIIPFLEEKLAILWLNEREAEEFIVYWLPQMENNKYNLIRFETKAEQDGNMPLNITPTPDTVIRVMMDWKAIDEPIDIPEQQLITPERSWFTVVERWWSPRN